MHELVSSSVTGLLRARGPAAVILAVTFRIIYSVKGVNAARTPSHVSQELGVVVKPLLTHSYAPKTISSVVFVIWIKAAGLHCRPSHVLSATAFHKTS